jgi:superfamily I DNA/RNA helicase
MLVAVYVQAKQKQNVLDYDDLLWLWAEAMHEPALAAEVGARFDHVLVDEYQDTNRLQASAANAVIDLAAERFTKNLWSDRESADLPTLVDVTDDNARAGYPRRGHPRQPRGRQRRSPGRRKPGLLML